MGKSKHRPSNVSSAANPSSTSKANPLNTHSSTILRSSFCPSQFQLSLFASVIRSLDDEHLRLHDTRTGHLRSDHSLDPSTSVTCLSWGLYGREQPISSKGKASKKRKRSVDTENTNHGDVVIAYGTTDSEVHFFSPNGAKNVGTLKDGHTGGVRDFKFVGDGSGGEGWSIGGDSRLIQWDLETGHAVRTLAMPTGLANVLQPLARAVICASHLAYCVFPEADQEPSKYSASTNLVRLIISSDCSSTNNHRFLTAAQNDRFLNVFEIGSASLIGSLRTEAEVVHADFAVSDGPPSLPVDGTALVDNLDQPKELLAIVNKDRLLELYPEPFEFGIAGSTQDSGSAKKRITQRTRKSACQICFVREYRSRCRIEVLNVQVHGEYLTVALVEAGSRISFETVHWQGQREAFIEICVAQGPNELNVTHMNGHKHMDKIQIDESHAVVSNGVAEMQDVAEKSRTEVIDISSAEEESESSEDNQSWLPPADVPQSSMNGALAETGVIKAGMDVDSQSPGLENTDGPADHEEPSFGERLRSAAPDPIDVTDVLAGAGQQMLVPVADQPVRQLPPGVSLGTILTQSLRTNDKDLLQTCFQIKDMSVVRATIERLDSNFAPLLVQRLVERFHSRPGRAGSLMVWIQWTLAAHGGYLTAKPEVMKHLMSLRRVVQERANSLPLLLSLKGKLDLLEAQKDLRENMHLKARILGETSEERMVYVEGQSESESESESGSEEEESTSTPTHAGQSRAKLVSMSPEGRGVVSSSALFSDNGDADSGTELPLANGNLSSSSNDSDASEAGGFLDEEASSTDQDSGNDFSDEVDHDDMDTGSSDGGDSPPPKRRAKLSDARRG